MPASTTPASRPSPSAWLPPPCSVCGHDTEVEPLPHGEGFSVDERVCLRCDQALLVGPLGPVWPVAADPAGQPRSA